MTAVILALAVAIGGQTPPAAPVPSTSSPADAVATAGQGQHRRDQITVMEGVLAAAVSNGARQAVRSLQGAATGPILFSAEPRARGFFLEGYGVFFNLEIPRVRASVAWSMQTLERDMAQAARAVSTLRALADSVADQNARKQYQAAVARIEQAVGVPPAQERQAGEVTAVNESLPVVEEMKDPQEVYTSSVISACVEAMIEHSKPMNLKADEWLTVALSAIEGPLAPGEITERETIVVRIKGSDLSDYLAGRTTRDEVRKKVEVRMF